MTSIFLPCTQNSIFFLNFYRKFLYYFNLVTMGKTNKIYLNTLTIVILYSIYKIFQTIANTSVTEKFNVNIIYIPYIVRYGFDLCTVRNGFTLYRYARIARYRTLQTVCRRYTVQNVKLNLGHIKFLKKKKQV